MDELTVAITYPARLGECEVTVERDDDYKTMVERIVEAVPINYLQTLIVAGSQIGWDLERSLLMGVFVISQHYLFSIGSFGEFPLLDDERGAFVDDMVSLMRKRLELED